MANHSFMEHAARAVTAIKGRYGKIEDLKDSGESLHLANSLTEIDTEVVVPFNCFPLEYEFGMNGIPLHRVVTLQGPTESSKSSMFWFLARLFLAHGGNVAYFDIENKHEPNLAQAYVGNPAAMAARVAVFKCDSPESFGSTLMEFSEKLLSDPELQKRPLLIGIDTLGSTLTAKFVSGIRKGSVDPGYSPAKSTNILQGILQGFVGKYLSRLPVTLFCLQQERKRMETGETYATGGSFARYTKSLALRMEKTGEWKSLDTIRPILRMKQEKQSMNTRRDLFLTIPTFSQRNEKDFLGYSFRWGYTMLELLARFPESYMSGLFKVNWDTDTLFSIIMPAAKKRDYPGKFEYGCSRVNWEVLGDTLMQDRELAAVLRKRLDIRECPVFPSPAASHVGLTGNMWISPDEVNPVPDSQAAIEAWHLDWMLHPENRKQVEATEEEIPEDAPVKKGRRKVAISDSDAATTSGPADAVDANDPSFDPAAALLAVAATVKEGPVI